MQKALVHLGPLHLVGLSVRTNTQQEMTPGKGKIGPLMADFFTQKVSEHITNPIYPSRTYAVYHNYASDEHGDYTYFIGVAVSSLAQIPTHLTQLTIPAAKYQRFTTLPGKIPAIVIDGWQKIWQMSAEALGGKRVYQADFEIYDERASNVENSVVDIYIGIE